MVVSKRLLCLLLGFISLVGSAGASATLITFIYTGSGSGSLGGVSFASTAFVITQTADTANVVSCGANCFSLDATTAMIAISGLGTFDFTTSTRSFASNGFTGFSRAGVNGSDLFYPGVTIPGYSLTTSAGPLAGTGRLLQWTLSNSIVSTTGGRLTFNDGNPAATFQAITSVPEPASLLLVATALAGLAGLRRIGGRVAS